jgi:hypothetical protein
MTIANQATPQNLQELVQSISVQVMGTGKFQRFQKMYKDDRIAFVYDCMPAYRKTLAPYQEEILGYFDDGAERVAVRSPHGAGKTWLAAAIVHHSVLTSELDAKIPTTASAWRQLEYYLWPEIRKLAKSLDWVTIGREPYGRDEIFQLKLRIGGVVEAFAVASDDHTTIEGAHATQIMYVFDEAKTIPRPTWDAAEGAFATGGIGRKEDYDYEEIVEQPGLILIEGDSNITSILIPDTLQEDDGREDVADNMGDSQEDIGVYDPRIGVTTVSIHTQPTTLSSVRTHEPMSDAPAQARPNVSQDKASIEHERASNTDIGWIDALRPEIIQDDIMEAKAFAISTPGIPSGQFYDIHIRKPGYEDWLTRHITVEEAIKAGRISAKWVRQRAKQWGIDSAIFQNRVLGDFADMSEEGIIPLSWIRAANNRWMVWYNKGADIGVLPGKRTVGVDTARSGDAKTVLALRNALSIVAIHVYSKLPLTSIAGHVQALSKGRYIHIETDGGYGAAVYDICKDDDVPLLRPITVNGKTHMRDKTGELGFANVRAAMWWNMRELLDPTLGYEVMLPPIELLRDDLATPRFEIKRNAIVKLESKKEIRLRIGRSTDYGDAVCLAFWQTSSGGGVVF